ncbi:MAG: hypothetical protein WC539_04520 [Nitrospirota bacterium]
MNYAIVGLVFVLLIGGSTAQAGEIRQIEMKDGSVLTGEVLSLNNGMYTIKSESLGIIKIEEAKIRSLQTPALNAGKPLNSSSQEVQSLQNTMMNNKEIMAMIQSLQDDPDFKKLLEDPKIMHAVTTGDVATLSADPRFKKIMNNPTVREIQKKVQ